ncbi:MAG: hypothetical protein IPK82_08275 [Polyangiaceae bacterium]|nr:hypothetical protein [Polyangiaceae bacterium]
MSSSELPDFGEDVDLTLRHVSRQFPMSFAKALLPDRWKVTAATWLDTQVTSRGKAVGEATALLRILERRGIAVPAEAREKILTCTTTAMLETWLDRALTAAGIDEVLTDS